MARKNRQRKQSGTRPKRAKPKSQNRGVLITAGVLAVALATGLFFIYGRDRGPGTASDRAAQLRQQGDLGAGLPPLSTRGRSIRGWHDMNNLPKNVKGRPLPKNRPQPDVLVRPASRDLGVVDRTEVVNLDYVVLNVGDQDLVIDNVVTSCGCTTAILSHNIIPPGQRADLAVRFDAGFHEVTKGERVVRVVRVVWLMSNDPDTPVAGARLVAIPR